MYIYIYISKYIDITHILILQFTDIYMQTHYLYLRYIYTYYNTFPLLIKVNALQFFV